MVSRVHQSVPNHTALPKARRPVDYNNNLLYSSNIDDPKIGADEPQIKRISRDQQGGSGGGDKDSRDPPKENGKTEELTRTSTVARAVEHFTSAFSTARSTGYNPDKLKKGVDEICRISPKAASLVEGTASHIQIRGREGIQPPSSSFMKEHIASGKFYWTMGWNGKAVFHLSTKALNDPEIAKAELLYASSFMKTHKDDYLSLYELARRGSCTQHQFIKKSLEMRYDAERELSGVGEELYKAKLAKNPEEAEKWLKQYGHDYYYLDEHGNFKFTDKEKCVRDCMSGYGARFLLDVHEQMEIREPEKKKEQDKSHNATSYDAHSYNDNDLQMILNRLTRERLEREGQEQRGLSALYNKMFAKRKSCAPGYV